MPPPQLRNTSSSSLRPTQSPFEPVVKTQRKKGVSLEVTGKALSINRVYVDADNNPLPPSMNPPTPSTDNDLTDTEAIENVWAEAEAWVEKEERKEQEASVLEGFSADASIEKVSVGAIEEEEKEDNDEVRIENERNSKEYDDDGVILCSKSNSLTQRGETFSRLVTYSKQKSPPRVTKNPPPSERKESWYSSSDDEEDVAPPPLPPAAPTPNVLRSKPSAVPSLNIQTPYQNKTNHSVHTPLSTTSNASSTASSRSFATPAYGNHYTLHDKLSSPERRRPSPAETKAKMDERVEAAALRRAERESAKKLKLAKAAEKIERAR